MLEIIAVHESNFVESLMFSYKMKLSNIFPKRSLFRKKKNHNQPIIKVQLVIFCLKEFLFMRDNIVETLVLPYKTKLSDVKKKDITIRRLVS